MNTNAQSLFRNGDIPSAHRALESLGQLNAESLELRATIDYLQGRYDDAIRGLTQVIEGSTWHPLRRNRARRRLALAYWQTNRFDKAARLPLRDPLTRLMRAFSAEPYVITWSGQSAVLPFLQDQPWELPRVSLTANGENLVAKIDTGGDLLSVPWSVAQRIGIDPVSKTTGWYAGGRRARVGRGILPCLELDGVRVENVPVALNSFDHAVVGTGLLRQFQPTLDYPGGKLVLRKRQTNDDQSGFPFLLAATHLLMATGSVNGVTAQLLVDSGLEVTNNAAFVAPDGTLTAAQIDPPKPETIEGMSGAGKTRLKIGEFLVDQLRLGSGIQRDAVGLTGVFPPQLAKASTIGFPIDGLVSHNFLRRYRWGLDFDNMRMTLTSP